MSPLKEERIELIAHAVGHTYVGTCIILGTFKLRFTVEFQGKTSSDRLVYDNSAEDRKKLLRAAKTHFQLLLSDAGIRTWH